MCQFTSLLTEHFDFLFESVVWLTLSRTDRMNVIVLGPGVSFTNFPGVFFFAAQLSFSSEAKTWARYSELEKFGLVLYLSGIYKLLWFPRKPCAI